jgi:hypothetical protein
MLVVVVVEVVEKKKQVLSFVSQRAVRSYLMGELS